MPEIELPPLAERRPGTRKRALLGGMVVYQDGRFSLPCTIRNLSDDGALLSIGAQETFPADFILINRRDQTGHKAHIVWRRRGQAGVRFEQSFPMDAVPPELAFLNRFANLLH